MVTAAALLGVLAATAGDGGVSLEPPEVTAFALLVDAGTPALDLDAGYPVDPFADQYLPPVESEVGPGAGQLRLFGLGGLTSAPDLLGELTAESLHLAFFAVRGVLSTELSNLGPAHAHLATARLGFAVHVAPYHRVDASLFVDAGVVVADVLTSQRRAAPVVVPGVALEVALTSHLFLRAEGQFLWAVLPATGSLLRGAGLLGLGWTL